MKPKLWVSLSLIALLFIISCSFVGLLVHHQYKKPDNSTIKKNHDPEWLTAPWKKFLGRSDNTTESPYHVFVLGDGRLVYSKKLLGNLIPIIGILFCLFLIISLLCYIFLSQRVNYNRMNYMEDVIQQVCSGCNETVTLPKEVISPKCPTCGREYE